MGKILQTIIFCLTFLNLSFAQTDSSTYTIGDLSTIFNGNPTTTDISYGCTDTLTVNIPAGNYVTSVDVYYEMEALGNGWVSDQASYLECLSTATKEAGITPGDPAINNTGVYSYQRTGLSIANGISATGQLEFFLHAFRTFSNNPACNPNVQNIPDSTWKIIVHHIPPPSCFQPTALTVSGISTNSATLGWTTGGASAWQIEYGPAGFTPGTGTLVGTTSNPYNLTGLQANTNYEFRVRDSCGVNDVSLWSSLSLFRTACSSFTAPFTENFDGGSWVSGAGGANAGNAIDNCWQRPSTANPNFGTRTGGTNSGATGPSADVSGTGNYLYTEASNGATGTGEISSPSIYIPNTMTAPQLEFYYHMFGNNITSLDVEIDDGSGFVNLTSITGAQQTASNDPWLFDTINLTAYKGDTVVLRFSGTNTGFNGDIAIDEVSIKEAPTCFDPTNLIVSNPTASSLQISWTTGGASNWLIGYRVNGSGGALTIVSATTNPFTLTGLTASVTYDIYVKDSCAAGDVSNWAGPEQLQTLCNPFTAPWNENFDGAGWVTGAGATNAGNTIDNCWTRPSPNNPNFGTGTGGTPSGATGPSGDVSGAGSYIYTEASGGGTGPGEINSPLIYIPNTMVNPVLEFSYHMYGNNITSLEIQIDNGSGFGTALKTITGQQQTANTDFWQTDTLDLLSFKGDTIIVKFIGTNGGFNGDIALDEISIDEPPACPDPQFFTLDFTWVNAASFSWTTGGATTWELEYGAPGFSPGTGTRVGVSSNPATINGLTPNTTYDIYVRDSCGVGSVSQWVGPLAFTTLCNTLTAPYLENFDSTIWNDGGNNTALGTIGSCWIRTPTTGFVWKAGPAPNQSALAGTANDYTTGTGGFIYSERLNFITPTVEAYIQSPPIDISSLTAPQLKFWYHMYGNSIVSLDVEINNGSGWTNIFNRTGQQQTSGTDPWKEAIVNLSAYLNDTVVIRFISVNNNGGTNNDVSIDDLEIAEAPSCPKPLNLSVIGQTNTTATLSWTTGGAAVWEIEYGTPGFSLGSGTRVTVASNPFTISGLTPNTNYEFYVRDSCGVGDVSEWSDPDSVLTDCDPLIAPFTEDFEGAVYTLGTNQNPGNVAACWRRDPASGYVFTTGQNGTPTNNTGPSVDHTTGTGKFIYSETYFSFGGFNPNETVLTTPLVDISGLTAPELKFYYHLFGNDITSLTVRVFNGTAWTVVANYPGATQTASTDAWLEEIVDLVAFIGDTIKVEFRALKGVGATTAADMAIDDISIDEKPACPKPGNLVASNATATTIDLSWTSGGATNWQIEYGSPGFTPGTGTTVIAAVNPFTVTGLLPSTAYEFYIRDSCSSGSLSDSVGPVLYNTLCVPTPAPYYENFDGANFDPGPVGFGIPGTIDACWSRNPTATYFWKPGPSNPQTNGTGPVSDHTTGSGGYIFTESGGFAQPPLSAEILSPAIDLSTLTNPELIFWYHMFGPNVGSLTVEISNNGGTSFSNLQTLTGNQQTSQADAWLESIINLSAFLNDTVIIRFTGDKTTFGNQSDIAVDDFSIDEAPNCPKPDSLSVSSISSTTVTLNWITGGAANWQVEYGPVGFTPGNGTRVNVSSKPYIVTGLAPKTGYCFFVRDSCGSGDVSAWSLEVCDTTECGLFTAPWSENFDGTDWLSGAGNLNIGNQISSCWSRPGPANPNFGTRTGGTPSNGTGPLNDISGTGNYLYTEASGGAQGTGQITSPSIYIPSAITNPRLTYSYHMYGTGIDSMVVMIDNGSGFTRVSSLVGQQQTSNGAAWLTDIVDITQYSGDTVKVRFLGTNNAFAADMAIDSVVIENAPNCPRPTNVQITNSAATSFTIDWVAGGATNWQIEYGPVGFVNGSGTIVNVPAKPFVLSGLSPNTGYDIYVRDSCGPSLVSTWSVVISDTTDCSVFSAPYSENFDGNTFLVGGGIGNPGSIDACWERTFANSYFWATEQNGTVSFNTGPASDHTTGAGKFMFTDGFGQPQQTELITPSVDISTLTTPELRFWYHMYGANIVKMEIDVWDGANWTNELILTGQQQTSNNDPWQEAVVSLSSYANDTIQVRFVGFRTGNQTANDMALDDVWIGDSTGCARADSVILISTTTNSITIQWNSFSGVGSMIKYRPAGSTGPFSYQAATTNTATISGLMPSTVYEIFVADSCGAGNLSLYTSGYLFSTNCGVITAPWTESFDGAGWLPGAGINNVGDLIQACWTRPTSTGVRWTTGTGPTGSNQTGPDNDITTGGQYIYTEATIGTGTSNIESPQIFIPTIFSQPVLGYYYHMYGVNIDSLLVQIDNGAGYSTLKSYAGQQQFANNDPWTNDTIDLTSYIGDTVSIRFVGINSGGFRGDIAVDQISITGPINNCSDPQNIVFSNIGNTSATVAWTSFSGISDIEVVLAGQPQGSGTLYNGVTSPYNITGLLPLTAYDIYITDICAGQISGTIDSTFTTTACPAVLGQFTENINLLNVGFDASGTSGQDTTFWDFGDGNVGTGINVNNNYAVPGTYTVTMVALNGCGNGDTVIKNISVCDSLIANFTFTQSNDSIFFDGSSSVGVSSYKWNFGDGTDTTGISIGTHRYINSGTYQIMLTVYNTCGDSSVFITTTQICGQPLAVWTYTIVSTTSAGMQVQFDGSASQNALNYLWDFGDLNTSTNAVPIHTYVVPSLQYLVKLTVTNACGVTDVLAYRLNQVGLEDVLSEGMVDMYPNPASQKVFIRYEGNNSEWATEISLYDVSGKKVLSENRMLNKTEEVALDISELAPGYYQLQLSDQNGPRSFQLIVK